MDADHFSLANIPFGIATSRKHPKKSVVTRLENNVIFLLDLCDAGHLPTLSYATVKTFYEPTINAFASLSKADQRATRVALQQLLKAPCLLPESSVEFVTSTSLHLPVAVGDFTDFSCSKDHLLNGSEAIANVRSLPPAFLKFPISYNGPTSSIVVSETPIRRPRGQFRVGDDVVYGATKELDYELEVACIIGRPTAMGDIVSLKDAEDHIFGLVLLNDWSARDIQSLEMAPLGPMNTKSFGTTISPWIITLDALSPFTTIVHSRESSPGPQFAGSSLSARTYDISLQAEIILNGVTTTVCRSELSSMYWNFNDMVVQQTSNGCSINTGDLLGTGTVSGATHDSHGCLLELTAGGQKNITLTGGERRTYLEDGDIVRISGRAGEGVGFGSCSGVVVPAHLENSHKASI